MLGLCGLLDDETEIVSPDDDPYLTHTKQVLSREFYELANAIHNSKMKVQLEEEMRSFMRKCIAKARGVAKISKRNDPQTSTSIQQSYCPPSNKERGNGGHSTYA